jgi:hypothetical protein
MMLSEGISGWPDEFVKKSPKNVAQIHFLPKW